MNITEFAKIAGVSKSAVSRYFNNGYLAEDKRQLIEKAIEKESGELIGDCGITMQDWNGREVPEIGYHLRRDKWHQGYAAEAARACRDYAFTVLGFPEVYSIIRDTNFPSQRVALRSGMAVRGSFVKHYRGIAMPHLVFSVKRGCAG